MKEIIIGASAEKRRRVQAGDLAAAVGSGSLEVLATPALIALMEGAALACLSDFLEQGETSVGTSVCIEHTAPSVVGTEVTATAVITAVNGREIIFEVAAADMKGEISRGSHKRFVVCGEKFMAKARLRLE